MLVDSGLDMEELKNIMGKGKVAVEGLEDWVPMNVSLSVLKIYGVVFGVLRT